ncbi:hypothetical protein LJC48_01835 [Desulfovibrio sp. OttesenSCG-928-C06]|nr:hypothetical protein [Desulfovibrio sp. OttesenSCG-928-C06]
MMLSELFADMMNSTPQGFVGVGLIVIYFGIILGTAIVRIVKADHMTHH